MEDTKAAASRKAQETVDRIKQLPERAKEAAETAAEELVDELLSAPAAWRTRARRIIRATDDARHEEAVRATDGARNEAENR